MLYCFYRSSFVCFILLNNIVINIDVIILITIINLIIININSLSNLRNSSCRNENPKYKLIVKSIIRNNVVNK